MLKKFLQLFKRRVSSVFFPIHVSVTQDHIKNGKQVSAISCPIALAIMDSVGLKHGVSVGTVEASIHFKSYPLPPEASTFISNFDLGRTVKPLEFELRRNNGK